MYKKTFQLIPIWRNGLFLKPLKNNVFILPIQNIPVSVLPRYVIYYRNYSTYNKYYERKQEKQLQNILKELENDEDGDYYNDTTSIHITKNDEAAQVKIDEFRKDPENDKIYKMLELELDWYRQEDKMVPSKLKPHEMLHLLEVRGVRKMKYLKYLCILEIKKDKKVQKQLEARKQLEEYRASLGPEDLEKKKFEYNLRGNSLFLRIYQQTINNLYNNNVLKSMMFGNRIIFDCSYDRFMSPFEIKSCAKQLMHAYSTNRIHDRPFYFHLCNAKRNSVFMQKLQNFIPTLYDDDFPMDISENSYLDLYDKKELCYLTPHCREELKIYDPNTTYIIGAFVDKTNKQNISLAKAKREGIRMARFPLELFLAWGSGSTKNLTLNTCSDIMLDIQVGNNWHDAMKHIPTRKLRSTREYVMKHELKKPRNTIERKEDNDESNNLYDKITKTITPNWQHQVEQKSQEEALLIQLEKNKSLKYNKGKEILRHKLKQDMENGNKDFSFNSRANMKNKWNL